jgi:iron complex outermembrane recepter protein
LRYEHPKGFWIGPNLDWSPATYFVNSPNTAQNDKYAVMNLRAGYDWNKFGIYVEGVNLTDRLYSASVQVDSDTGTFFQPSNGRSIIGGIRVRF